jgi:sulfoxide reductase heme-binding subunit YedZ
MITKVQLLRGAVFIAAALPAAYIALEIGRAINGLPNGLGADPGKAVVVFIGEWALRFLLITLAITPVRKLGLRMLARVRRMLGLYTFFYATIHISAYFVLLLDLRWGDLLADVVERPYITVGAAAWLGLVPLAITSTNAWMRRLRRNWMRLHRVVYVVAVLALIHLVWIARSDYAEALVYAVVVCVLFAARLASAWWPKRRWDGASRPAGGAEGCTRH